MATSQKCTRGLTLKERIFKLISYELEFAHDLAISNITDVSCSPRFESFVAVVLASMFQGLVKKSAGKHSRLSSIDLTK